MLTESYKWIWTVFVTRRCLERLSFICRKSGKNQTFNFSVDILIVSIVSLGIALFSLYISSQYHFSYLQILISLHYHHYQSVLPKGRSFTAKRRNQGRSSVQRQVFHYKLRNNVAVLQGMNRCGSFPLLSAPHSLFSISTHLKRSEKIPGAPPWK